jgi:hypothetical protein
MTIMNLQLIRKHVMGPNSFKMAMCHKNAIVSTYENQVLNLVDPEKGMKPFEHKCIYKGTDVDVHIH